VLLCHVIGNQQYFINRGHDTTQKQSKLVTSINKTLLITNDMTQKQLKLVTRINEILLIINDMTQKQFKLVTRINEI
jgi:hypothetical protein